MIGEIERTSPYKPKTPSEERLKSLRGLLESWQAGGYGLEYPADAATRLQVGEDILKAKRTLIETGLYRVKAKDRMDGKARAGTGVLGK